MSATLTLVVTVEDMTPDALREEMYNRLSAAIRGDIEYALWANLNPEAGGRRHAPFIDVTFDSWSVTE